MSPICPSLIRFSNSCLARQCRTINPTPTFRFFFFASSFSASIRFVVGPSTVTGFSMNVCRPLSMACVNCTQRNAGGVPRITTSPDFIESIAFL